LINTKYIFIVNISSDINVDTISIDLDKLKNDLF
jgi:hypothetical protein